MNHLYISSHFGEKKWDGMGILSPNFFSSLLKKVPIREIGQDPYLKFSSFLQILTISPVLGNIEPQSSVMTIMCRTIRHYYIG